MWIVNAPFVFRVEVFPLASSFLIVYITRLPPISTHSHPAKWVAGFSETLVTIRMATWCHKLEDHSLNNEGC